MNKKNGVFKDLLVVEVASVLAGPSVGQFFAELGATVIKIENIHSGGDVTRSWKLTSEPGSSTVSAYFAAANLGKQSVCLDLKSKEIQEMVGVLLDKADVVLTSFKPGDAEKLNLDFGTLSNRNPRLIYGHITGYGLNSSRAGYDAVIQAEAGFMYLNGEKGGPPLKMPVALVDLLAAHQLKEGLLAALFQRERTGQGEYVEVSLFRTAIASLANQATNFLVAGQEPQRMGSEHPNIVPYGTVFTTSDQKQLVLAIGDDRQFRVLCQVLQKPELADRPEYKQNKDRVENREKLNDQLSLLVSTHFRDSLLQILIAKHVPAGAVHSIPEALAQPLAQPQMLEGAHLRGVRQIAFQGLGQEPLQLTDPPELGQHSWQVLSRWCGVTKSQFEELSKNQLVYEGHRQKE